jgi:hypothetical protein
MIEEILERSRTVMEFESKADDLRQTEMAIDFLLRVRRSGIFYKTGNSAYMIPIQHTLGYRVAPLRMN